MKEFLLEQLKKVGINDTNKKYLLEMIDNKDISITDLNEHSRKTTILSSYLRYKLNSNGNILTDEMKKIANELHITHLKNLVYSDDLFEIILAKLRTNTSFNKINDLFHKYNLYSVERVNKKYWEELATYVYSLSSSIKHEIYKYGPAEFKSLCMSYARKEGAKKRKATREKNKQKKIERAKVTLDNIKKDKDEVEKFFDFVNGNFGSSFLKKKLALKGVNHDHIRKIWHKIKDHGKIYDFLVTYNLDDEYLFEIINKEDSFETMIRFNPSYYQNCQENFRKNISRLFENDKLKDSKRNEIGIIYLSEELKFIRSLSTYSSFLALLTEEQVDKYKKIASLYLLKYSGATKDYAIRNINMKLKNLVDNLSFLKMLYCCNKIKYEKTKEDVQKYLDEQKNASKYNFLLHGIFNSKTDIYQKMDFINYIMIEPKEELRRNLATYVCHLTGAYSV